ncbi:hypothetical protein L596_006633 [Steinernema carpocapsae]|uniref:Protein zer-1 homolog-like C-terminal domain-containing protein n=1 Tax=Steinernema carpocapsae TaxID=34508 RepID=A0A4U8V5J3_STECR|nr:hypothetical protein L596_006633 [Steinernema carpocapsae]
MSKPKPKMLQEASPSLLSPLMTIAIVSILAPKIPVKKSQLLATEQRYIQFMINVLQENLVNPNGRMINLNNEDNDDINVFTLKFTLSALWNLTDESPRACEIFVQLGGVEAVFQIIGKYDDNANIVTKVFGLLNNIAEVAHLRTYLIREDFVKTIITSFKNDVEKIRNYVDSLQKPAEEENHIEDPESEDSSCEEEDELEDEESDYEMQADDGSNNVEVVLEGVEAHPIDHPQLLDDNMEDEEEDVEDEDEEEEEEEMIDTDVEEDEDFDSSSDSDSSDDSSSSDEDEEEEEEEERRDEQDPALPLSSPRIDVAYFAAGILSNLLLHEEEWNFMPDKKDCNDLLVEAITNWPLTITTMVAYRSFSPFIPILTRHDLSGAQMWAVYAIYHVCCVDRQYEYITMLRKQGAYDLFQQIANGERTFDIRDRLRDLAKCVLTTFESCP